MLSRACVSGGAIPSSKFRPSSKDVEGSCRRAFGPDSVTAAAVPLNWAARYRTAGFPTRTAPPAFHDLPRAPRRGKPGVENMLGHAPPPLTPRGLDMRDGHPADWSRLIRKRGSHAPARYGAGTRLSSLRAGNKRRPRSRAADIRCCRCFMLRNAIGRRLPLWATARLRDHRAPACIVGGRLWTANTICDVMMRSLRKPQEPRAKLRGSHTQDWPGHSRTRLIGSSHTHRFRQAHPHSRTARPPNPYLCSGTGVGTVR